MHIDVGPFESRARVPLNLTRDEGSYTDSGGCKLHLVLSSNATYLWCQAYQNQYQQVTCYAVNPAPATLYAVSAINKSSTIRFRINESGRCYALHVENSSWHLNS